MKEIEQINTWLGQRMKNMSEAELAELFKEISGFRRTGVLKGEQLRNLAKEFSDNVAHTDYGQNMRLVEDEVLFEMSRRYYNSFSINSLEKKTFNVIMTYVFKKSFSAK